MSRIKIFDSSSYPDTINKIREKLDFISGDIRTELCTTSYLQDDIYTLIWVKGHPLLNLQIEIILNGFMKV